MGLALRHLGWHVTGSDADPASAQRALELGAIEEVWFDGPDGNRLHGWVMTPPGFDPAQRYPAILEIHGGPQTQYGNMYMHEFHYLAAAGYVVTWSNPRALARLTAHGL